MASPIEASPPGFQVSASYICERTMHFVQCAETPAKTVTTKARGQVRAPSQPAAHGAKCRAKYERSR